VAAKIVMRSAVGVPCRMDEAPELSGLVPAFAAPTGTRPLELLAPEWEGGELLDPLDVAPVFEPVEGVVMLKYESTDSDKHDASLLAPTVIVLLHASLSPESSTKN